MSRARRRRKSGETDGPHQSAEIYERASRIQGEKAASFEKPGRLIVEKAGPPDENMQSLFAAQVLASSIDRLFIYLNTIPEDSSKIAGAEVDQSRIANLINSTGAIQFLGMGWNLITSHKQKIEQWMKTSARVTSPQSLRSMVVQSFESPQVKWGEIGTAQSLPEFEVAAESGDGILELSITLQDGEIKLGAVVDGITHTTAPKLDVRSRKKLLTILNQSSQEFFRQKKISQINREQIGVFLLKLHDKMVQSGFDQGFFERATAGMFFHLPTKLFMVRAADTQWSVTTVDEAKQEIVTLMPPDNHIQRFDDQQVSPSHMRMYPGMPPDLVAVAQATAMENIKVTVNAGAKMNPPTKRTGVAAFGHGGPIENFIELDEVDIDPSAYLSIQLFSDGFLEMCKVLEIAQPWLFALAIETNSFGTRVDSLQGKRERLSAKIEANLTGKRIEKTPQLLARQLLARPFVLAQLAVMTLMMLGKVPKTMDYRFKRDDTSLLGWRSATETTEVQRIIFNAVLPHSIHREKIIADYPHQSDGGWQRFAILYKLFTGTDLPLLGESLEKTTAYGLRPQVDEISGSLFGLDDYIHFLNPQPKTK